MKNIHVSGKRKTAIARATLTPGRGIVRVNDKLITQITPVISQLKCREPLLLAGDTVNAIDIDVTVNGGGPNAQAEAVRLAIGRALATYDKKLENTFLDYDRTLLVADVRRRESRKPNTHGKARSKRQTSYR
jgi:small subunit ribosomal protein S9